MNNVQNRDDYVNIPLSQTYSRGGGGMLLQVNPFDESHKRM
jgi:hypothetical protein